jgi:hypothetical protein
VIHNHKDLIKSSRVAPMKDVTGGIATRVASQPALAVAALASSLSHAPAQIFIAVYISFAVEA